MRVQDPEGRGYGLRWMGNEEANMPLPARGHIVKRSLCL
jgi:hypothetical protein